MLDQLQANLGKQVVIELTNGKKVSGTLVEANLQFVRMETEEGVATFAYSAAQILWETPLKRSLTEENMEYIANKLRSEEQSRINCTAISGFTCLNRYICIPPDNCVYTFACPGVYTPGQPQGGCPAFQFFQPCSFYFYQPCGFPFFFVPCGFRFTQPCYFPFQQPCFFPFGSQCTAPGGFACPGQAFIGIAPGQDVKAESAEKKE